MAPEKFSMTPEEAQEMSESLAVFKLDITYFEEHQSKWSKQYDEQWVAVFDQKFVGVDPDFYELIKKLEKDGIPPHECFIQFVEENPSPLILLVV